MTEHVYKVIELVGSSEQSVSQAIERAIARASETVRNLGWFEVAQVRGHIENGKVKHYQVTLKVGFRIEDEDLEDLKTVRDAVDYVVARLDAS